MLFFFNRRVDMSWDNHVVQGIIQTSFVFKNTACATLKSTKNDQQFQKTKNKQVDVILQFLFHPMDSFSIVSFCHVAPPPTKKAHCLVNVAEVRVPKQLPALRIHNFVGLSGQNLLIPKGTMSVVGFFRLFFKRKKVLL